MNIFARISGSKLSLPTLAALCALAMNGCSSAPTAAVERQRSALIEGTGLRCRYIRQGDVPQEFELQLNISMASECDPVRPFSIIPFSADSSNTRGVVFCCSKDRIKETDLKQESPLRNQTPEIEKPVSSPSPSPTASPSPASNLVPEPSPSPEATDTKKDVQ